MIDPLSTIAAPPPRYLLESDSSDEEGQGAYAGGSVPKIRTAAPEISVRWTDAVPGSLTGAVVGVGQAGKYLARRAGARMALLVVEIGGTTVGTGFAFGEDGILVVLEEMEKGAFEVVETLVGAVKAESWTVFSSYVPALYIPSASERTQTDPPVRCLSTCAAGGDAALTAYDAPNYVTGVAGAFLSQATHPAFSNTATWLFLLPLPLSRIAPAGVEAALATLPPALAAPFARGVRWTEADDEPHSGLGMGARRAKDLMTSADLGGMYM